MPDPGALRQQLVDLLGAPVRPGAGRAEAAPEAAPAGPGAR